MWQSDYVHYVERHLYYYYAWPEEVVLLHGQDVAGDGQKVVRVIDSGTAQMDNPPQEWTFDYWEEIPVLFYEGKLPLIEVHDNTVWLHGDLIAAIFCLLSGWQELGRSEDDRMYCQHTWQGLRGFEQIALVDRYFDFLAQAASHLAGRKVKRRDHLPPGGSVFLSHDIDRLKSGRWQGAYHAFRKGLVGKGLKGLLAGRDPWDNLPDICALEEQYQVRSTFFMLTEKGRHSQGYNADYSLSEKLRHWMINADAEGWEIALHGSLGSHLDDKQLKGEAQKLPGKPEGVRFHFLKISPEMSWGVIAAAGLQYDATLGFPDAVGFRNGTCFPFRPYNFQNNNMAEVVCLPLHAMDTTFQHSRYLHLTPASSELALEKLWAEVSGLGGCFSLLWHNNYFSDYKYEGWREVYQNFLLKRAGTSPAFTAANLYQRFKEI